MKRKLVIMMTRITSTSKLLMIALLISSCTVARFFKWNFANIDDYKRFKNAQIQNNPDGVSSLNYNIQDSLIFPKMRLKGEEFTFEQGLEKSKTVAFLVMRNDTVLYEKYFDKYTESTWVNSFSVTKSFVSTMIGIAISEGYITSINDPIGKYIPNLR